MSKGNNNDAGRRTAEGERRRGSSSGNVSPNKSSAARKKTSPSSKPRKSKSGKSQYIVFYIVTLIVAVIVCLATFAFVLSRVMGNGSPGLVERPGTQQSAPGANVNNSEEPPVVAIDEIGLTGVIVDVNQAGRTLEILDIDSLTTLDFRADNTTIMQNRAGEVMSFTQFRAGDIVDIRYRETSDALTSMNLTSEAWEYRNVDNVVVNPADRTISVDGRFYRYSDQTIAVFNNAPYNISDINPLNVVTVRGISSNVWFVEVNRGTGFINIINSERIIDGVIEIDNNITHNLNEENASDESVRVPTGNRQIVVRGSNIHDFILNMDVGLNEQTTLDLSAVQIRSGVVSFNINEPGATIVINGIIKPSNEPLILDYGSYELVVTKEGFVTYETEFELNQPSLELAINLERDVERVSLTVVTTNAATGGALPGVSVYIDNVFIGHTPLNALVEIGDRMLAIRKEGFMSLNFMTDGRLRYDIALQEQVAAGAPAAP